MYFCVRQKGRDVEIVQVLRAIECVDGDRRCRERQALVDDALDNAQQNGSQRLGIFRLVVVAAGYFGRRFQYGQVDIKTDGVRCYDLWASRRCTDVDRGQVRRDIVETATVAGAVAGRAAEVR